MSELQSVLRTVDLPIGSVVPFKPAAGERVRVLFGRVWITEEGSPHDAFIGSGEEMRLGGGGLAVVEALGPARIQLVRDLPAPHFALEVAARVGRALGRLRRPGLRPPRGVRAAV